MSNETKQTVVDWLIEQFIKQRIIIVDKTTYYIKYKHEIILEQAKAMHKEEMINFGNDLLAQNDINYIGVPNLAEQYYNETYGGNK
jgi:hypothetical protein